MTDTAPSLTGRTYRLRSVLPVDYDYLYEWSTQPPTSLTWRFRGQTPSPESFPNLLWNGVLTQFAITRVDAPHPIVGLVQAFDHDSMNRIAYLGILVGPEAQGQGTAAAEGIVLLLDYLFSNFDLRKVYAETYDGAVGGLARITATWDAVSEEGRLTGHLFHNGSFHDLVILAIDRDRFAASRSAIIRLVEAPTPSGSVLARSFSDFVAALPAELIPLLESQSPITGGLRLGDDLGVDSLGLIEIICWVEDTYNVALEIAEPIVTLQDLYARYEWATQL